LLLTELGIHTVLAATGNGSWLDVGLDVAALATLGYGATLDASAEALEETAKEAGVEDIVDNHELTSAIKGFIEQVAALKEEAPEFGDDQFSLAVDKFADNVKAFEKSVIGFTKGDAKEEAEAIERQVTEDSSSPLSAAKDLGLHGSRGAGKAFGVATKLAERFPDNPQIAQALKSLKVLGTKNAITFLSGTTVDAADKTLSLTSPTYNDFKDSLSGALPADIGIPVVTAAELFGPTDFILHTTEFASSATHGNGGGR
jgi:hypothetical protein